MPTHLERELKLDAPVDFSLARLPERLDGCVAASARLHRLHTRYFDTPGFRLSRWGCSLRYRVGEGWTLKLPRCAAQRASQDGLHRAEHVFAGNLRTVPAGALELTAAYRRGVPVEAVAELRTLRTSRDVRTNAGDALAQIVEDDVRIIAGSRITDRFRQVEIELADGVDGESLDVLAALLRDCGAGRPNPVPKDVRALGRDPADVEVAKPKLDRDAPTLDVARAAFARSVERIVRSDAAIRVQRDSEAVHKARTSVRRLRSELRTFRPILDRAWAQALAERLRPLGDALGAARDGDVLLKRIEGDAPNLPADDGQWSSAVIGTFRRTRDEAYERLGAFLREPAYITLLDDLIAAVESPHGEEHVCPKAQDMAPALLAAVWKRTRKCVRKRSRPATDAQLHRIRIKAKHLRYAAEAFAPVLGRRATRLAKAVEHLQTILGDQHDAAVAAGRLTEALSASRSSFVAGELAQRQRDIAASEREKWQGAWRAVKRRHDALCR